MTEYFFSCTLSLASHIDPPLFLHMQSKEERRGGVVYIACRLPRSMDFDIDCVTGCSTNQVAAKVVASLFLSTHLHANALLCGKFNIIMCASEEL